MSITITYKHPRFNELAIEWFLKRNYPSTYLTGPIDNLIGLVKITSEDFLSGDIKFNNLKANMLMYISNVKAPIRMLSLGINPFTANCGIKAIDYITTFQVLNKEMFDVIESFLWHQCNCGIVVASDSESGSHIGETLRNCRDAGGYIESPLVWNPNYTWDQKGNHKITMMYKDLNQKEYVDYWGDHDQPEMFTRFRR